MANRTQGQGRDSPPARAHRTSPVKLQKRTAGPRPHSPDSHIHRPITTRSGIYSHASRSPPLGHEQFIDGQLPPGVNSQSPTYVRTFRHNPESGKYLADTLTNMALMDDAGQRSSPVHSSSKEDLGLGAERCQLRRSSPRTDLSSLERDLDRSEQQPLGTMNRNPSRSRRDSTQPEPRKAAPYCLQAEHNQRYPTKEHPLKDRTPYSILRNPKNSPTPHPLAHQPNQKRVSFAEVQHLSSSPPPPGTTIYEKIERRPSHLASSYLPRCKDPRCSLHQVGTFHTHNVTVAANAQHPAYRTTSIKLPMGYPEPCPRPFQAEASTVNGSEEGARPGKGSRRRMWCVRVWRWVKRKVGWVSRGTKLPSSRDQPRA